MKKLQDSEIQKLQDDYERVCGKRCPEHNAKEWLTVDTYIQILKDAIAKGPEGEAIPFVDSPLILFHRK